MKVIDFSLTNNVILKLVSNFTFQCSHTQFQMSLLQSKLRHILFKVYPSTVSQPFPFLYFNKSWQFLFLDSYLLIEIDFEMFFMIKV